MSSAFEHLLQQIRWLYVYMYASYIYMCVCVCVCVCMYVNVGRSETKLTKSVKYGILQH